MPAVSPSHAHTVASLARHVGGEINGRADLAIAGVAALNEAGPSEITFIADRVHAAKWRQCAAAAAVITRGLVADGHDPHSRALIEVADAELAMAALLELFQPPHVRPEPGVHPSAFIHPDARLGSEVRIGPHASVDRGAEIGAGVVLHAGVRIYAEVAVGEGSELHANCVVRERCRLGRRVILHQNVSIGGDGFGYRPGGDGRGLVKMPHIGAVLIEDDVEIGSNSCVDRGKFRNTVIGAGTKIDNLVQIAHNCIIGRGCVIAALTGLAGSVSLGDGVRIAAQVGMVEGVTIGAGAQVGAKAGVMDDVPPGAAVLGVPAQNHREMLRQIAALRKLPELIQRLRDTL
jgi:UDP-3-O-[3-hydroxymyristoyl] glucosamine N-acyltransferase